MSSDKRYADPLMYVIFTSILISFLCISATISESSRNFCTGLTFSHQTPDECNAIPITQNCLIYEHKIDDPQNMLGASGKFVTWIYVFGYSNLIFGLITTFYLHQMQIKEDMKSMYFYISIVYCLLYGTWTIYGFTLSYSSDFPVQCPDYELGNNLIYILLQGFCLYNLVLIPVSVYAMYSVLHYHIKPDVDLNDEEPDDQNAIEDTNNFRRSIFAPNSKS
jgi:hypothetical protein